MRNDSAQNTISIIVGAENSLGKNLERCLLDNSHSVLSIACKEGADGSNSASTVSKTNSERCETLYAGREIEAFGGALTCKLSGRRVSNVIFCQELDEDRAVVERPVESWKKYSRLNIEIPLSILDVCCSQLNPSSKILFLTRSQAFLPVVNNGFYAASNTAMAFLMQAFKLENPGLSITSGTVDDSSLFESPSHSENRTAIDSSRFYEEISDDIVKLLSLAHTAFVEKEWTFFSNVLADESKVEKLESSLP